MCNHHEDMTSTCPMCSQPNAPIGVLGTRAHYNCRYCGWWYSETVDADFDADTLDDINGYALPR